MNNADLLTEIQNIEKLLDSIDAKIEKLSEEMENIRSHKEIDSEKLASKNEELNKVFEMANRLQEQVKLREDALNTEGQ